MALGPPGVEGQNFVTVPHWPTMVAKKSRSLVCFEEDWATPGTMCPEVGQGVCLSWQAGYCYSMGTNLLAAGGELGFEAGQSQKDQQESDRAPPERGQRPMVAH